MILRIQALLLAFIITLPVALTAFTEWGYTGPEIEFCDNLPVEERETDKQKEKECVEEYDLVNKNQLANLNSCASKYSSSCNVLANFSGDVLTPPPEYI